MSTFSGLSIGISGLYANKKALDTTSHNISNVNNPYYVRQQVIQSSSKYNQISGGNNQLGTGVDIQQIRQIRDDYLDASFRDYSQDIGYWSARNTVFSQVEEVLNETDSSGLQKVMDQFWNSFEELSKNPDNLTMRGLVKERSVAFVETVNHISEQLDNIQINLNLDIKNAVSEMNGIGKRIAQINGDIKKIETSKVKANDLRDERNNLLDSLSKLANVSYYEDETGAVNVSIGGKQLVNSDNFAKLITKTDGSSYVDIYWSDNNEKVNINNGELYGLLLGRGDVENTILGKNNGAINNEIETSFLNFTTEDISTFVSDFNDDMIKRDFDSTFKNNSEPTIDFDTIKNHINDPSIFSSRTNKSLIIKANSDISITDSQVEELKDLGITISVIGDTSSLGWSKIVNATGGKLLDTNTSVTELSFEASNMMSRDMGKVESYEEIIPNIKQKLNVFVSTLARNINYIHRQGITLDGNSGEEFFVSLNGKPIQADNISLNPNLSDLNTIAVSESGSKGDGKIAEQIAGVREQYIFGDLNIDGYYRDVISDVGVAANQSATMESSSTIVREEVDNRRKSISGVSLDEEMADMLKYQHSYAANSRVINAMDEMIENVINKVGLVGR